MNKQIAVVGVGANGAAIAVDMQLAGYEVTCIEQWPAHVEAIRADGVRIDSPDGSRVTPLDVLHLCEVATLRRSFDLVFFVVKAYDTRWHAELVKPLVAEDGLVIGLQNGMTIDVMAEIFGPDRTMGAVIEIAGNMFEPGVVTRQTGPDGTWFAVGSYDEAARGREDEIAGPLRAAGLVEITSDIRSAKWMKLVANAAEMLPSAILGVPLLEALAVDGMRELMDAAGTEALEAALGIGCKIVPMFGREGIDLLPPEQYSAALLDAVLAGWSLEDTRVAMLQDWIKGRRAEGEEINGLAASVMRELNGSAPANERLLEVAGRIEMGEIEPDLSNADLILSAIE